MALRTRWDADAGSEDPAPADHGNGRRASSTVMRPASRGRGGLVAASDIGVAPAEVHDPVETPRLRVVPRELLRPPGPRGRRVGPREPQTDGTTRQDVVAGEDAHSLLEASGQRRVDVAGASGRRPPDAPQGIGGVPLPKCQALPGPAW